MESTNGQRMVIICLFALLHLHTCSIIDNNITVGPWIVTTSFGKTNEIAHNARNQYEKRAKSSKSKRFSIIRSFEDREGLNAVVVDGALYSDLVQINNVVNVYPDFNLSNAESSSWGIIRLNKATLPLLSAYQPQFHGCGVNIYLLDTGIDSNHFEFGNTNGLNRTVTNIYSSYGNTSADTDGSGHGTFCAGIVIGLNLSILHLFLKNNIMQLHFLKPLQEEGLLACPHVRIYLV